MARFKIAIALAIILCLCGFETRNPFRTRGPFKAADFSVGGGSFPQANGVLARTTQLLSQGVQACDEPMNGAEPPSGVISDQYDFQSSDNATECFASFGSKPTYLGLIQLPRSWSSVTVASQSLTGWGSLEYVAKYNGETFMLGFDPQKVGSGTKTLCSNYYAQFIGTAGVGNGQCGVRHKLMQANWGTNPGGAVKNQIQLEESSNGSGCTQSNIDAVWDSGDLADQGGFLSPSVKLSNCSAAPCLFEQCVSGDIAAGTGITVRYKITQANGTESTLTAATNHDFNTTPSFRFAWGNNWDHTGGGSIYYGAAAAALWPDANQTYWIGCHPEVVGTSLCPGVAP